MESKKVINDVDLDCYLIQLIADIMPHNIEFQEFFQVLYDTGLRAEEVLEQKRWSYEGNGVWGVKCCKKSNYRMFYAHELNDQFVKEMLRNTGRYLAINYSSLNYFLTKCLKGLRFSVGNKGIYLHLFRYNYVRRLSASGKSVEDISNKLGHKNVDNTLGYLKNPITYEI